MFRNRYAHDRQQISLPFFSFNQIAKIQALLYLILDIMVLIAFR